MGSVFAMQGIGQFTAAMIALIVTSGFKQSLLSAPTAARCDGVCNVAVDKMWRIIIGFGAVPGCIALYYRLTIPETPRYTFDVARDVEKAGEDTKAYIQGRPEGHPDEIRRVTTFQDSAGRLETPKASWTDFFRHYSQWKHGKVLLGTAGSWFTLDVAFYGLGLNNSIILTAIGYAKGDSMYKIFYNTAVGNLIIVCAGSIPGYWVTVALVDTVGRKPIQLMGFAMLTIIFICIGFAYDKLLKHNGALLALYVLAQFFFNFGRSRVLISPCTPRPVFFSLDSANLLLMQSQPVQFRPANGPQAPTQPLSSCRANVSPPATAPRRTASRPRRARLAPSLHKPSLARCGRAAQPRAPPATPPPRGSITSCRSSPSSCFSASSPPCSFRRPSVRRSRNWRARCLARRITIPSAAGTARAIEAIRKAGVAVLTGKRFDREFRASFLQVLLITHRAYFG